VDIYSIIDKTKNKKTLCEAEIKFLVNGYVSGAIPDYQMSAWLMAVCINGISDDETFYLTKAMLNSGDKLSWESINGITADKHSTGGVGDKTSLIIAPAVSACGVYMPKMSGRGLGHTGGTIDKLESIPDFQVSVDFDKFLETVNKTGFAIVSQSGKLVPADKKIYALRDATATVDSIPLIASSIMSKKLATGADCIVLDVKCGNGAFMKNKKDAETLARLMIKSAEFAGRKCRAVITDMNCPLGKNIGNALEVIEAVNILKNKQHDDLYKLCMELTANIVMLAKNIPHDEAYIMAEKTIENGSALEKFREFISRHGGNSDIIDNPSLLPQPKYSYKVKADKSGWISEINSQEIGMCALLLGAGRKTKEDNIDYSAGIVLEKNIENHVENGDIIMTLYTSKECDFIEIEKRILNAVVISDKKVSKNNIIIEIL
jgi:pyrimidine-nucleoside phosphorylase